MGNQDFSEDIGTKATGCYGTYQNIGIEKHPHGIWENTSSSVKYPRASANGITLFLISSKFSKRSCRLRASRAMTLLFFPDR
jgi:hypothetical protein